MKSYESFILPLAVVPSLPAGVFGSFLLLKRSVTEEVTHHG